MPGLLASSSRRPLLIFGLAVCLLYQNRNRLRSGPQPAARHREPSPGHDGTEETRRWIAVLEDLQPQDQGWTRTRAVVLSGGHRVSDTEVQLYQQVLQQMDYEVHTSRYAETSNRGVSGWSLLFCLSTSERSCLRRISFSQLLSHQMVNLIPSLMDAFSDAGGGLCQLFTQGGPTVFDLPMRPYSCGPTNQKLQSPRDRAPPPGPVAVVNVYVLVTSVRPLTSFLHQISMVTTNQEPRGRPAKLTDFLLQQLGPSSSQHALGQIKRVIGEVLQAASANERKPKVDRCVLCYQLLTFTLLVSSAATPVIVQVETDLSFSALSDETFDRQVHRDLVLEDTLHFLLRGRGLLSWETHDGGCRGTRRLCLSEDEFRLLLRFHQQLARPSSFQLLFPSPASCPAHSSPLSFSDLLVRIGCFYELQRNLSSRSDDARASANPASAAGPCVDPHLRQIYTDPPLTLTPPFSPWVKEYRAEVSFDTVTVRIRPESANPSCRVHLDEHRGPRMANYPVGLGDSRISILVTDGAEQEPVVMTIYSIHVFRESRPILPMFGDHVTCGFVQDCGLLVRPAQSCGLQPFIGSQSPLETCSSGHQPGRWVVPCLSCTDNRTCDWREVAWQPDGCYHPAVDRPLLQVCMTDRKVLFIGDSTNRGMMYFLMEKVNSSLEDWGKAHDTLVYGNLNSGRTLVSYSYYPQFWLERGRRPTFAAALLQLIHRSRPLVDSEQTVLVVGGVQWLSTNHLRTVRELLDRESLSHILVVVKTLGMGFHLRVDGIRSLSLREIQGLDQQNDNLIATAKHFGYEVIDTFGITMGRYKEFLQGRCACHFHEVEKSWSSRSPGNTTTRNVRAGQRSARQEVGQGAEPNTATYHVKGQVNQVYSEILLSRLCTRT